MVGEAVSQQRILVLHHNFPGQFGGQCRHRAALGDDVVFASERISGAAIAGVRNLLVEGAPSKPSGGLHSQLSCGARFARTMQSLAAEGWQPNVVLSHSGWGCGLEAARIFPKAVRIAYLEWWFADQAQNWSFDPGNTWLRYSEAFQAKQRQRNLTVALELSEADHVVCPTEWQREQLPHALQQRAQVISDGVDTDYFVANRNWRPKQHLRLTYATRGMEPMRGFPEFIAALEALLPHCPKLEVVIAGEDRVCYGSSLPKEGSFGRWARRRLETAGIEQQVKFTGRLSLESYARLLKSSHLHCYLSRPFVASWSLLEAMASGCCLVASAVPPVLELAAREATLWCQHAQSESLQAALQQGLALGQMERAERGEAQRARAVRHFSRRESLERWDGLLANCHKQASTRLTQPEPII